jgi:DNA-binding XRE family transcriptional regulator
MATLYDVSPILTARAADRALRAHQDSRAAGLKLAWMREQAGVSQRELAAYIGTSRTTLRRVEAGERALRPHERVLAAKALGASLATFVVVSNGNGNGAS